MGRRNTVVVWNCSDHLQHWLWHMEIWGRSRGSLVEPLAISTNVSKRAVSDEKLITNHCGTCNALKIVCLCLFNMKRAKITITRIWRKSVPGWLKLTVSFSRVANYGLLRNRPPFEKAVIISEVCCAGFFCPKKTEYEFFSFCFSIS